MGGSGLQELLEVIYADSAVSHILTGKTISRTIRGHILIEAVLYAMILSMIFEVPISYKENGNKERDSPVHRETTEAPEMMEYCLSEKVTDTLKETNKSLVQAVERTVVE